MIAYACLNPSWKILVKGVPVYFTYILQQYFTDIGRPSNYPSASDETLYRSKYTTWMQQNLQYNHIK